LVRHLPRSLTLVRFSNNATDNRNDSHFKSTGSKRELAHCDDELISLVDRWHVSHAQYFLLHRRFLRMDQCR